MQVNYKALQGFEAVAVSRRSAVLINDQLLYYFLGTLTPLCPAGGVGGGPSMQRSVGAITFVTQHKCT